MCLLGAISCFPSNVSSLFLFLKEIFRPNRKFLSVNMFLTVTKLFWGENHIITSRNNNRQRWRLYFEFLLYNFSFVEMIWKVSLSGWGFLLFAKKNIRNTFIISETQIITKPQTKAQYKRWKQRLLICLGQKRGN